MQAQPELDSDVDNGALTGGIDAVRLHHLKTPWLAARLEFEARSDRGSSDKRP